MFALGESPRQAFGSIRLALVVAALSASTVVQGVEPVEQRLEQLSSDFGKALAAQDWNAARSALFAMAALDPQHPKIHTGIALAEFRGAPRPFGPVLVDGPGLELQQGYRALLAKDDDDALRAGARALEGYGELGHRAGQAAAHTLEGLALRRMARLEEATTELGMGLDLVIALGDRAAEADIRSNLGKIELDRSNLGGALRYEHQALDIRIALRDLEGQAKSWAEIGRIQGKNHDSGEEAIEAFERSVALRRRTGDRLAQATTLRELAFARSRTAQWGPSVEALEQSVNLLKQVGKDSLLSLTLLDLGNVQLVQGRSAAAVTTLEQAVALYRRSADRAGLGRALLRAGNARAALGDFGPARAELEEAAQIASSIHDSKLEADALSDLAIALQSIEDLSGAYRCLERTLPIYRALGDQSASVRSLGNLAALYFRLGDFARASAALEQARTLADALGDSRESARLLENLGVVHLESDDVPLATRELLEALARWEATGDPREVAWCRRNAAEALGRDGALDEALQMSDRALAGFEASADREGQADALNTRAALLLQAGQTRAALECGSRAFQLARAHGLRREEWRALAHSAAALDALGQPQHAMADFISAIGVLESTRSDLETDEFRVRFLARERPLFESAVTLQRRLEPAGSGAPRAFVLAERAKARGLLDLLSETRAAVRADLPHELQQRQGSLLAQAAEALGRLAQSDDLGDAAKARRDVNAIEDQLNGFDLRIRKTIPRAGLLALPVPASIRQVAAVLAPDETLLSYFIAHDQSYVWTVERGGASLTQLDAPAVIARGVQALLDRMGQPGAGFDGKPPGQAEAEALGRSLLPTVLTPERRLIVAPDGPLYRLPFAALRQAGHALAEAHEIVVVPSASTLELMRRRPARKASSNLLLAGAPAGAGAEALPFAAEELRQLAALYPENERTLLVGARFTRNNLLALPLDTFGRIHLATHGWIDSADPRHVGLALSPESGQSGPAILSLREVLAMKLNAELVALPACHSAQGELLPGEGLLSLTRAFLHAGARTVLASLWDLDDRSAADFIEQFYGHLRDGRSAADALRRTQRAFIGSDRAAQRHPYRWAPFVLIGDASTPTALRSAP
jgi:tetratricopeptide (TPR) repeat protein